MLCVWCCRELTSVVPCAACAAPVAVCLWCPAVPAVRVCVADAACEQAVRNVGSVVQ